MYNYLYKINSRKCYEYLQQFNVIGGFGLNELRIDWEGHHSGKQTVKNSNILSSPLSVGIAIFQNIGIYITQGVEVIYILAIFRIFIHIDL